MYSFLFAAGVLALLSDRGHGFSPFPVSSSLRKSLVSSPTSLNNLFTDMGDALHDMGDALTGGKLVPQTEPLVYGTPLGGDDTLSEELRTLAVQERLVSFTGEDFDIQDLDINEPYCKVRGAMLHLPGKDKMRISLGGEQVAILDRKLIAITPTYDILRADGEKIGWIEKATIALTDTFEFHAECAPHFGPIKPPAAYRLEGDFLDRRFVMKNDKGEAVAKITMDRLIEFDAWDHYQIRIAPGMDPVLVVACACAIDEEFDEEHKKKREAEGR
ncbi:unnamed protein product [Pseudo-nitzschia multistriata]|uniref:Phospholipid scramblase n=1 Tax=Pseudo-nitzschia multistriata TaxID=183589 RepID=A0A448YVH3_9STRA|nr:unnamed protein product [Pseudo-nitzschia multistriata]